MIWFLKVGSELQRAVGKGNVAVDAGHFGLVAGGQVELQQEWLKPRAIPPGTGGCWRNTRSSTQVRGSPTWQVQVCTSGTVGSLRWGYSPALATRPV